MNILGIRENARFTFMIFVAAAIILLNLIVSGFLRLDAYALGQMHQAATQTVKRVSSGFILGDYRIFISSIAFHIPPYSRVKSVI